MALASSSKITPCLWFSNNAEEAAQFYVGIFPNARIVQTTRYPEAGKEVHGQTPGSVLTVDFVLDGQSFTGLNGGPVFTFTEAVSFQIMCETQDEVDHYWSRLGDGGPVEAQQCGWVKDRFGLSWQVVPKGMVRMLSDPDGVKVNRVFGAMMQMKKLDLAALERAFAG